MKSTGIYDFEILMCQLFPNIQISWIFGFKVIAGVPLGYHILAGPTRYAFEPGT